MTQCSLPPGPPLGAGAAGAGGGAGGEYPAGDKGPPRPLETVTCFKVRQKIRKEEHEKEKEKQSSREDERSTEQKYSEEVTRKRGRD